MKLSKGMDSFSAWSSHVNNVAPGEMFFLVYSLKLISESFERRKL